MGVVLKSGQLGIECTSFKAGPNQNGDLSDAHVGDKYSEQVSCMLVSETKGCPKSLI